MVIYIGADHRGYKMKNTLIDYIKSKGYEVADMGAKTYDDSDDYPDYAKKVALNVSLEYENSRGIVICGSGVGVDVVANKFERIRCALIHNTDQAYDSRNDDDSNVLALPADYISIETAKKIVFTWLETPFSGESRHRRRIDKIFRVEEGACKDVSRDNF